MQLTLFEDVQESPQPYLCGKTSPACYPQKTTPSAAFWAHWPAKTYRLSRQGQGGRVQVLCLDTGAKSLGVPLTLNFSECPSDAVASFLWQVLEPAAPPKYYLSDRAALGILNRAVRRGKTLPPMLERRLIGITQSAPTPP